jgi:hypothetical protein
MGERKPFCLLLEKVGHNQVFIVEKVCLKKEINR